jgi:hypothetical protein
MVDQTGVDVYERAKYSEDHRKYRDVDGDASKEMPVEHATTLTRRTSSGIAASRNLYHATSGRDQAAVLAGMYFLKSLAPPAQNLLDRAGGWADQQLPDGTVILSGHPCMVS